MNKKLDAYVRITCDEASDLAKSAIAGIKHMRCCQVLAEVDKLVEQTTKPRWWLLGRPQWTESNVRAFVTRRLREIADGALVCWEDLEYDCWYATNLHSDEFRKATVLLQSSRGRGKGSYVLINPEDMAQLRAMADDMPRKC